MLRISCGDPWHCNRQEWKNKKPLLPTKQVGSPNLPKFLKHHADLLKSDYAISADGGQIRCNAVGA